MSDDELMDGLLLGLQCGATLVDIMGDTFNPAPEDLHRTIGPALGVNMWLCFREYDEKTYAGPPLLSNVLKIKQGLKL